MVTHRHLLGLLVLTTSLAAAAPLDQAKLLADYRAADAAFKDGKGWSESAESGTLGWGEAPYLTNYMRCWAVSHDPYWLEKVVDHADRILASATDPDGDGFLGWQTVSYSAAVYWCSALRNRGTGIIDPPFYSETHKPAADITGHVYVISFDEADLFSVWDQTTRMPVAMKRPFRDGALITAIPGCRVKVSGAVAAGDRFMVRTLQPEPTEYTVHEGMIAIPIAQFIEVVKRDAELQERFGTSADRYLAFIGRHMLQKHEYDWLTLPDGSGAWRFRDLITDRFPNRIMPHNQYLALARAFLILKDVPGTDSLMGRRAEQMARLFRASLIERDAAFTWHYWDWMENGAADHSGFEDTSHGHIDVGFAVEAATRGVVFTDADLKRLTRTVLDLMWNQSEDNPRLGPNCATRGDKFSFVTGGWLELCRWEPKIYELALKAYAPTMSAAGAPLMLWAESVSGLKWDPQPHDRTQQEPWRDQ